MLESLTPLHRNSSDARNQETPRISQLLQAASTNLRAHSLQQRPRLSCKPKPRKWRNFAMQCLNTTTSEQMKMMSSLKKCIFPNTTTITRICLHTSSSEKKDWISNTTAQITTLTSYSCWWSSRRMKSGRQLWFSNWLTASSARKFQWSTISSYSNLLSAS